MSLYNMLHGVNPCCFWILPMLGRHPDQYPRFRDCFLEDEERPQHNGRIQVYTRAGGGNRDDYELEIIGLRSMETYVTDHDDSFDSTYATFVFEVPGRWQDDYEKIRAGEVGEISEEYTQQMFTVYPKLKEQLLTFIEESKKADAQVDIEDQEEGT